jgi:hypothetical protein
MIGTDISSNWTFTEHGDLELISDENNLVQSIINRLGCWLNSLDLYYLEYGSIFLSFLGWKREQGTLDFMKLEIQNTLRQDPRIDSYTLDIDFNESGGVDVFLDLNVNDDNVMVNLVISSDGSISILEAE